MPTPAKKEVIDDLNRAFTDARSAVLANYQGIKANDLAAFRVMMKERQLDFRVIKNTLAEKASKGTPFEALDGQFSGPLSLLISYDDLIAPAKALKDYAKSGAEKSPEVLAGIVEGKAIDPAQVKALADLPPKEVLISQMLSVMQGPTRNFAGVFSSMLRKLVGTLEAVKEKKAGS